MNNKIIIAALCLCLGGCYGTRFSYDEARQVQVGMTDEQVIDIMGNPYQIRSQLNGEQWLYHYVNGFTMGSKSVSFWIKDGKVTVIPNISNALDDI